MAGYPVGDRVRRGELRGVAGDLKGAGGAATKIVQGFPAFAAVIMYLTQKRVLTCELLFHLQPQESVPFPRYADSADFCS